MDLKTEVKVSKSQRPEGWFLTDLEMGVIHEPPEPLFICKYYAVYCGINYSVVLMN